MAETVFSWILEGTEAQASRIMVKLGNRIVADTEWKQLDTLATKVHVGLQPRSVYTWLVYVKTTDGQLIESAANSFETGKMQEHWSAEWITCSSKEKRLPIFSKEININPKKKIQKARLYICGLGLYEAYLNGEKIGKEYLTPGCNAYDQWLQVQTYPIEDQLQQTNKISVILGDGWYKGRFHFEGDTAGIYGKTLKLIAEVCITYEDGTVDVIGTDESWEVSRSNIIFSGIYDGEQRDDTLETLHIERAFLSEERVTVLQDRISIPILEKENLPVTLYRTPKNELVADTGQNMAGLFRLHVHVPRGTKIHLQFGEVLQDGCFYRDNLRTAKAEYIYISDGEEHVLRPLFTFYGFRYVKIEGISDLKAEDLEVFAIYSDIKMRGTLTTGNAKINQLISNVVWGMKSNFVGNPTDCPQRDERMGWTGDAQVFSETACYLADTYSFYQKFLYDIEKEQKKWGGMVPDVVPTFKCVKGTSVWGDSTCIIPWNLYCFYGDKAILESHYVYMKAWLAYIGEIDGKDHGWRKVFHYGDWLALDSPYKGAAQTRGGTDEGYIADIYYRKSALITAKAARILGKEEEAFVYEDLADKILSGIVEEYFSVTGRCCISTQTAALLNLQENINETERAAELLKTLLENNENKLSTGFVGTPILCQVLTKIGMEKEAFDILLNEEYPGWLYEVNLGATTIWERWNSLDQTGHISSTGMNSLNHYAYGAILGWIWKDVVGLRCLEDAPGFRKVELSPHVNWKLRNVNAIFDSPAGQYQIYWELVDMKHIHLKIQIPEGCTANIKLPYFDTVAVDGQNPIFAERVGNICCVKGGIYEVTYETTTALVEVLSIDVKLRKLMANSNAKKILYLEFPQVANLMSYTGDYPLSETMRNLKYDEELIQRLDGLLRESSFSES